MMGRKETAGGEKRALSSNPPLRFLYSVMLWGVGLSGGYLLAYHGFPGISPMQSPHAFWLMSLSALALVGACLLYLVWRNTNAKVNQITSV
jgi:hypothetical protein